MGLWIFLGRVGGSRRGKIQVKLPSGLQLGDRLTLGKGTKGASHRVRSRIVDWGFLRMKRALLGLLLMPLLLGLLSRGLSAQVSTKGASLPVILEVMNYHFTMGRQIPSVFLRVLSDGSVECHSLRATGPEANVVKKKVLTPGAVQEVKGVVEQSELLDAKRRYERTHPVFDSWMEWDIRIPRTTGTQDIAIAAFASTPLREGHYSIAVARLGCLISKLRDEVYGDEPDYRRRECKNISMAQ
jgi:hypothetical protein